MKQWTVTYREKSGLKTSVVIEAEDRAGVFAELKQRGINAISITEGAVKAKRKATGGVSKGVWGVVAAVVAVALVVVVWVVMQGEDEVVVKEVRSKARSVTKEGNDENVREFQVSKNEAPVNVFKKDGAKQKEQESVKTKPEIGTNGLPIATLRGPKQRYEDALKRGLKPLFKHECEQWLAQYAIPGEASPPPPISKGTAINFVESLSSPIEILDTDTPREREIKEGVIALKKELDAWMKDGGSFEEYMAKLQTRQEQEAAYMSDAHELIVKEFEESNGDFEHALKAWRTVNNRLEADGLRRMRLPVKIRVALGRAGYEIPTE